MIFPSFASPEGNSPPIHPLSRPREVWVFAGLALALGGGLGFLVGAGVNALLLAIGMGALAAGLVVVARPELGLLVLAFITYTRFSDTMVQYQGAPSLAKWILGGLVVLVVLRWAVMRQEPRGWSRVVLLGGAYLLISVSGLLYARDPERTLIALDDLVKDITLAALVVALLQQRRQLRPLVWSFLAAGAFMASITTFQYLTNRFDAEFWGFGQTAVMNIVGSLEGRRISGPIGDPNFYAQILVVLVPLALDRIWNEKSLLLRGAAVYILAALLSSILFTFSRGAFIVLGVTIFLALLYRRPRPAEWIFMLVVVILALPLIPSKFIDRLATVADLTGGTTAIRSEVSFRGRASELLAAWQMFKDHPLIGVGTHNYPAYYQDYSQQIGLDPRSEARQAHNLFLEVAAENGVVGLSVFFSLLFFCFRSLWRTWKGFERLGDGEGAGIVASIAIAFGAYLLTSMFIHAAYPRYFWLLVGLALALPQILPVAYAPKKVGGRANG